jgi:predicted AAA+ superfamily ATPase
LLRAVSLLRGIDLTRDILIENTERFARRDPNFRIDGARRRGGQDELGAVATDGANLHGHIREF